MADVLSWGLEHDIEDETSEKGRRVQGNWIIELDTASSGEGRKRILSDTRYPIRLSPFEDDQTLRCEDARLKQDKKAPNAWHLFVAWSDTTNGSNAEPTFIDNPLRRPAVIQSGSYETTERLEEDEDGDKVTTTAGELLFLEIPVDYRMFTVEKNVTRVQDELAEQGNFVNSDAFKIAGHTFKKGKLHLKHVNTVGPNWENGFRFYKATYTILSNPKGWLFRRRNVGFQEKGDKVRVTLADGTVKTIEPLVAIEIGIPGRRQYPTQPVLISPEGKAYRGKNDQGQTVVLTPESSNGSTGGITPAQWKASELLFRGYKWLNFTNTIPLK